MLVITPGRLLGLAQFSISRSSESCKIADFQRANLKWDSTSTIVVLDKTVLALKCGRILPCWGSLWGLFRCPPHRTIQVAHANRSFPPLNCRCRSADLSNRCGCMKSRMQSWTTCRISIPSLIAQRTEMCTCRLRISRITASRERHWTASAQHRRRLTRTAPCIPLRGEISAITSG